MFTLEALTQSVGEGASRSFIDTDYWFSSTHCGEENQKPWLLVAA